MQDQRRLHSLRSSAVILLIAALVGCATKGADGRKPATAPAEAMSSLDPCPQRLHDLSGGLLLYYVQHQKLPPSLGALPLPGGATAESDTFVCPVSGQPYVYDPRGLPAPDHKSRMIVYDSSPAHSGRRWAITMNIMQGEPPVTDVLAVPESYFASP